MDDELVSVIMAVYNGEQYVARAIESILHQTYHKCELVICDDCSTDGTYNILMKYKGRYPDRVTIIRNERNQKLSYSLNRCIDCAKGKYIARMDADDQSTQERIATQVTFLRNNPQYDLVGCGMRVFDGVSLCGVKTNKAVPNKMDLVRNPCFAHATIMTYKRVYESLGKYTVSKRTERGQDYDLWFRFFANGYKGYNLQEPLYIVTEDKECYKRKKLKYRFYSSMTALKGYRLVGIPIKYYVFPFISLLTGLIPSTLLKSYHERKTKRL